MIESGAPGRCPSGTRTARRRDTRQAGESVRGLQSRCRWVRGGAARTARHDLAARRRRDLHAQRGARLRARRHLHDQPLPVRRQDRELLAFAVLGRHNDVEVRARALLARDGQRHLDPHARLGRRRRVEHHRRACEAGLRWSCEERHGRRGAGPPFGALAVSIWPGCTVGGSLTAMRRCVSIESCSRLPACTLGGLRTPARVQGVGGQARRWWWAADRLGSTLVRARTA